MLYEGCGRAEVDACLDDFVSGDAEIVLPEIGALDVWLLGGNDTSSFDFSEWDPYVFRT